MSSYDNAQRRFDLEEEPDPEWEETKECLYESLQEILAEDTAFLPEEDMYG